MGYPTFEPNLVIVAASISLQPPATEWKPARVLIADDNASMRMAIRLVLQRMQQVEVCGVAANGIEAVEVALALRPDLVILDMVKPGLSGVQAAGILKKRLPATKIILFTLYEDSVSKNLAKFAGIEIVIEKSRGLSLLAEKISSVIEQIS